MNVLIVDDEKNIREGLKSIIPWKELGFTQVLEASDGEKAYDSLKDNPPDICIMDIKMPKKDGVLVIESLYNHHLATKFIILSGYGEFEYAKRLMLCGVQDYMLKPIDENILITKIKALQQTILNSKVVDDIVSKEYMKNWLDGRIYKEGFHELDIPWKSYQVVKLFIFDDLTRKEHHKILVTIESYFPKHQYSLKIDHDFVIILKNRRFTHNFKTFLALYEDLNRCVTSTVYITIGQPVVDYKEVSESFNTCKRLIHYSHYNKHISTYKDFRTINMDKLNQGKIITDMVQLLQLFEKKALELKFNELYNFFQQQFVKKQEVLLTYITIYNLIVDKILDQSQSIKEKTLLQTAFALTIQECDYIEDMHNFFSDSIIKIGQTYNTQVDQDVCMKAKTYIDEHFCHDIKAYMLADIFGYNHAYFGQMFKEKIGMSLQKYIEDVRINKSKELLLTHNIKVYEIAKCCGFNDPDYFTTKFKKCTGVSPLAFRKRGGLNF